MSSSKPHKSSLKKSDTSSSSNLDDEHQQQQQRDHSQYNEFQRQRLHDANAKFLSNSLDDLNPRPRIRVAFRSPLRTTLSNTSLNRDRSLSRSTEIIEIKESRENRSGEEEGADEETACEISGIDPTHRSRQNIKNNKPPLARNESTSGGESDTNNNNMNSVDPSSATKLNRIINSSIEKELEKAMNRLNKRKVRVPQLLRQIESTRGKDRRALEEELTLIMRKHKHDKKMLEMYGFECPEGFAPTPVKMTEVARKKADRSKPWESGYSSLEDLLSDKKRISSDYEFDMVKNLKKIETSRSQPAVAQRSKIDEMSTERIEHIAEAAEIDIQVNVNPSGRPNR
jgi:hypothetical protein